MFNMPWETRTSHFDMLEDTWVKDKFWHAQRYLTNKYLTCSQRLFLLALRHLNDIFRHALRNLADLLCVLGDLNDMRVSRYCYYTAAAGMNRLLNQLITIFISLYGGVHWLENCYLRNKITILHYMSRRLTFDYTLFSYKINFRLKKKASQFRAPKGIWSGVPGSAHVTFSGAGNYLSSRLV